MTAGFLGFEVDMVEVIIVLPKDDVAGKRS